MELIENSVLIFAFVLGALVGSFLNVVILRLPAKGSSIVFPASHCPHCQTPLAWFDNIPVLSFLILKGRCRSCHASISWQYPLVEMAMALLSLALAYRFGLGPAFFIYFVYVAALLAIIVIDLYHQIIPDVISLPGIILGLAASFALPGLNWLASLLGILIGGGIFYAIALGYYLITKRQGMGGGDIKLLAMIGAFQGWQAIPFVIFASSLLGTFIGLGAMIKQGKGGQTKIPYGPFLASAALLYLFFSPAIDQALLTYLLPPS
ncbi:MAG: prepilin peptidase [Thermodesulfobacteriota bacterium]